jgi:hypothetical protein
MTHDKDNCSFPFSSSSKNTCGYSLTPSHIVMTYCIITVCKRINFPFIALNIVIETKCVLKCVGAGIFKILFSECQDLHG